MATYDKKTAPEDDFESAFNADTPSSPVQTEDQAFGIEPEGADDQASDTGTEGGEPAAVVIVADAAPAAGAEGSTAPADAGAEASANQAAASDAKAVTDEANAKAATAAGAASTGTQEAAAEGSATQAAGAPDANAGVAAEESGETPATEAAEMAGGLDDLSDVPPEDLQKARSWIGRLRKIEADLKAKGDSPATEAAPVADAIEEGSMEKLEQGDEAGALKLDQVADQVASGEITPEEAMKSLAEDFGEPFVKMIQAVASAAAGKATDEKLGPVAQNVDQVISHLTDEAARKHFEQIYSAHPDFVEIDASPDFKAFVAAKGAQQIVDSGSADQINSLISEFKASKPGTEAPATDVADAGGAAAAPAESQVDESAADDAEGVRSTGMKLPEQPKRSEDYLEAWDQF